MDVDYRVSSIGRYLRQEHPWPQAILINQKQVSVESVINNITPIYFEVIKIPIMLVVDTPNW